MKRYVLAVEFIDDSYMSKIYRKYLSMFYKLHKELNDELEKNGIIKRLNLANKEELIRKHIMRMEAMYYYYKI